MGNKIEYLLDVVSEDKIIYDIYDDGFFYGKSVYYKKDCWFVGTPKEVFANMGFDIDSKKCEEMMNIVDGDIEVLYYISACKTEEALKWFTGPIAAMKKETPEKTFGEIFNPTLLAIFGEKITNGQIPKAFSKDVFSELVELMADGIPMIDDLTIDEYEKYEYSHDYWGGIPKNFYHVVDDVMKNDKYKLADNSVVVEIVKQILAANMDAVEKVRKGDLKMINWLVGQCMKEGKGKVSPVEVKSELETQLG